MKIVLQITLLLVIASTRMLAAKPRSVLTIRLSDNTPLVVTIDNRDYNKYGSNITIGDLPRGWHDLRVYEYVEYKRGGGRAKLLYSGRIKLEAGSLTECVVDARSGRMRMTSSDITVANENPDYAGDRYSEREKMDNILNNSDLNDLKARVESRITDTEKMDLMKSVLSTRKYYTVQVRTMCNWLTFESTKLDFAKWAFKGVLDKNDYWKLEDIFTFSSSKDEFNKYISQR